MSAKSSRTATKAIGQRRTSQNHVNAPERSALRAIASPSLPPKTTSRSIPAKTSPDARTRTSEMSRTRQMGRVSSRP